MCHHQKTNTQIFTGRMPFLLLNLQCQSTEGKALKEMKAYHQIYGFGRQFGNWVM